MTDKTPEEKAAELAASVTSSKAANKVDPGKKQKAIFIIAVTVAAAGVLGYVWWPRSEQESLQTSERTSFVQDTGDAFGNVGKPTPQPAQDPNPELLQKIKDLQAMIDQLQNREPETVRDDTEINALKAAMDDLRSRMDSAASEYERTLQGRDREIQRLQNELDAIRLSNGEDVDNEEARRLAAQQLFERRIKSPLRALGGAGGGETAKESAPDFALDQRRLSQNELFARASAKPAPVEQAKIVANPSNTVLQGTVIQASLETAINTDLPGAIRAVVSEDVHSLDGRRVLIPRGAKVLGKYSDNISLGQKRVMVIWERILLPDHQTVTINSYGADAIGQAGVRGKVDTHFFERFGSATLISVIGVAPAVATAALSDQNGNNDSDGYSEATTLANAISQNMQSSLGGVIGEYLNRPPTIGVHQGANITIFVDRDLEIF